jgi:predicted MFS family arabinose efflux permease
MRWLVLGAFVLVVAISQLLWLNFAPILTEIQARYGVGELEASALVLVFPLLYVVLSLPAGRLVDTRGYRFTVGLGALVMALGAALRIDDASFAMLLAGQITIAVAQPFVVNGISKLVGDWFSREQGAIATGLGTMGMFLGMAAGLAATPPLVAAAGLRGAMIVFAAASGAAAAAFLLVARPNPAAPPADGAAGGGVIALVKDRQLLLIFAMAFLGLGAFNGLTTWLEGILAPQGLGSEQAGTVGGVLIVGGIVGSVVIPLLSDRLRRRKPFLIGCVAAAVLLLHPLCSLDRYGLVVGLGAAFGFTFLPAFALLLDMCAAHAGEQRAGSATGILMLVGNAGGVVVPLAMQALKGEAPTFARAIVLLVALLGAALLLALGARETAAPEPRA